MVHDVSVRSMTPTVLDREIYTDIEAAEHLRVHLTTLRRWLEGATRSGVHYDPVLRHEPTGSRNVTWGEFVEADFLRQYRRVHDVSLGHLRAFIKDLRERLDVPYPLAHARPWIGPGKKLLIAAQDNVDLEPALWSAWQPVSGQIMLTAAADSFLRRVTFSQKTEHGIVSILHPAGKESSIVIDPDTRFGAPHLSGISTSVLFDAIRAGESVEAVASDYDLTIEQVAEAINFESLASRLAA